MARKTAKKLGAAKSTSKASATSTKKAPVAKSKGKTATPPAAKKASPAKKTSIKKVGPTANKSKKPALQSQTSDQPRAKILTCALDHSRSNDRVRLKWKLDGEDTPSGEFDVSTQAIREQATRIRASLATLEAITAPFKADSDDYATALRDLATQGEVLAKLALGGGEARHGASPAFFKWFMSNIAKASAGQYEILFIHMNLNAIDNRKYVAPWHLAFTPGAKIDSLAPTVEGFGRFWCLQYRLVAVTPGYVDSVRMDPLFPNQTRISAVLEVGRYRVRGIDQRLNDKKDRADERSLLRPHELLDSSGERSTNHRFNYIWLHPSGDGAFEFDDEFVAYQFDDDILDKSLIEKSVSAVKSDRFMMTMFDGDCIMRDRTSWIEPVMKRLRGGLIAPETDIRLESQRHFGWRFLKAMIMHACSLSDAIAHARSELWPRSLIYGFYCNARHVYVVRKPEKALLDLFKEIDDFIRDNYSEDAR